MRIEENPQQQLGCKRGFIQALYAKLADALSRRMENLRTSSNCLAGEEVVYKYDLEDEAQRLLKEVKIAIEQVKESKFYAKLKEQIASDEFQEQLKSVLESHSKLKMVIYALGCLEFGYNPHYQLAIGMLLEQDFSWIEGIEVYDPLFSSADIIVLKELGCNVLVVNESCRRKVEQPTLFYMPYPSFMLVENLLQANWCPSQINQMIILTKKFQDPDLDPDANEKPYKNGIYKYTKAICAENYGRMYDNIFYEFAWHFFHVDSQLDMETLIAGKLSETAMIKHPCCGVISSVSEKNPKYFFYRLAVKRFKTAFAKDAEAGRTDWTIYYGRYRGPRKYRCCWNPPPKGWIKLNVSGIGAGGETNQAGFGGICRDEFKETILVYNGSLGKVDGSAAFVEALKQGLRCLLGKDEHKKLIVEGDDLKVIQWLNNHHEPPEEICGSLYEILDLLTRFNCVIYHIYEEANLDTISLSKKAAMS